MNIQAWAEMITTLMGAYDINTKFDDRDIFAVTDTCRGVLLGEMLKAGEFPSGDFIRDYELEVEEAGHGLFDVNLPVIIANGPDNLGIRSITGTEPPFTPWNIIDAGRSGQYKDSDLGGRPVCWLVGQRLKARNTMGCKKVLAYLIPSLTDPSLDTDYEIFGNSYVEGKVKDMVMQSLMIKKQSPKISANDGRV